MILSNLEIHKALDEGRLVIVCRQQKWHRLGLLVRGEFQVLPVVQTNFTANQHRKGRRRSLFELFV